MNTTLRIGLIGSGGMAAARAERLAALPASVLVAVAGRNQATVHALASRWRVAAVPDWRDLVARDDVDAVCIATHPDTHAAMAQAALAQGKHVFVETPLALDLADADAIVAAEQGRVVRVGLTSAYRPHARLIAEHVARLGGPLLDDLRIHYPHDARDGRVAGFDLRVSGHPLVYAVALGNGAIAERGPVVSLRASARLTGDGRPVFETCLCTVELTFASGAISSIAYLRGLAFPGRGWRTVACPGGSVRYRDGDDAVEVLTAEGATRYAVPPGDPWREEIDDFIRAIREGAPLRVPLTEARRLVAITAAAQRAAAGGGALTEPL